MRTPTNECGRFPGLTGKDEQRRTIREFVQARVDVVGTRSTILSAPWRTSFPCCRIVVSIARTLVVGYRRDTIKCVPVQVGACSRRTFSSMKYMVGVLPTPYFWASFSPDIPAACTSREERHESVLAPAHSLPYPSYRDSRGIHRSLEGGSRLRSAHVRPISTYGPSVSLSSDEPSHALSHGHAALGSGA